MFDLIDRDKIDMISGTSLSPSPEGLKRFYANIGEYSKKIVLRPQEISNNGEVVRRIGVIGMNTALEMDIYGHVNSTHVTGTKLMNGIGGSGDFTRNAYLSIFTTPAVAKDGKISAIVPMVSHLDHSEHSVKILITEYGVADLRGKSPSERAKEIIEKAVHPDYRELLWDYMKLTKGCHTPECLQKALSFHIAFEKEGDMHKADFSGDCCGK